MCLEPDEAGLRKGAPDQRLEDRPAEVLMAEMKRVSRDTLVIKDHLLHGLPSKVILRAMDWVGNFRHGVSLPWNHRWKAVHCH